MWRAVCYWLSLNETERGSDSAGRVCVVCVRSSIPQRTHAATLFLFSLFSFFFFFHMQLYKYIPGSTKAFYIPSGEKQPSPLAPPSTTPSALCHSHWVVFSPCPHVEPVMNNGSYLSWGSAHHEVDRLSWGYACSPWIGSVSMTDANHRPQSPS